jgi:3-oxoisoapionate decarboxylase
MTRRTFVATAAAVSAASRTLGAQQRATLGIASDCFPIRRLSDPFALAEMAAQLRSAGMQVALCQFDVEKARKLRARLEQLGLFFVASVGIPSDDPAQFRETVRIAKESGAAVLRFASGGRRYEVFNTLEERNAWVSTTLRRIKMAVPIVEAAKIRMGLENHKDFTIDEQVKLLKEYSSEYFGACVDTGNNIALLEDPMEVVEKLAPFAVSVHLKDAVLDEYEEGFLLGDITLGEGMLDIPRIYKTLRRDNPKVYFTLEMITRDALKIPCLTDKYWATFPDRHARYLARTLALVRANKPRKPLLAISKLEKEAALKAEMDHVQRSLAFARDTLAMA